MAAELRITIKVRLPIDSRNPREIADATGDLDKAVAALKEALAPGAVEAADLRIVQVRSTTDEQRSGSPARPRTT